MQAQAKKREALANAPDGKPKANKLEEILATELEWPATDVGCALELQCLPRNFTDVESKH